MTTINPPALTDSFMDKKSSPDSRKNRRELPPSKGAQGDESFRNISPKL